MTPETQAVAWARMQGVLSTCQFRVWSYLVSRPGRTRNEIDAALRAPGVVNANYSRRLVELEAMGVLRRGGERACSISGHRCVEWFAVDAEPVKQRRTASERARKARAFDEIAKLIEEKPGAVSLSQVEAIVEQTRSA